MGADWNLRNNPRQEHKYFPTHSFWHRSNQVFMKHYHRIMRTYYRMSSTDLISDIDEWEKIIKRVSEYSKYTKVYHKRYE